MNDRKVLLLLITIMAVVAAIAVGCAFVFLYSAHVEQERARLVEAARGQARLMEAVARFDAEYSREDHPGGSRGATLSQIEEAFRYHGDYQGSEQFVLGERLGDAIVFIRSQSRDESLIPAPIPFIGEAAEPMRRALSGQSGTLVGLDYEGVTVLAAYEPVAEDMR